MEHEGASMRILLVDDDKILSGILAKVLQNHEFVVDVTWTGEGGLRFAKRQIYDAIVLDIMLPAIDGLTVLKRLRAEQNQTPVLLLTARRDVEDRVRGLQLGADDYLTKPFDYEEFLARVLAIIRRAKWQGEASLPER